MPTTNGRGGSQNPAGASSRNRTANSRARSEFSALRLRVDPAPLRFRLRFLADVACSSIAARAGLGSSTLADSTTIGGGGALGFGSALAFALRRTSRLSASKQRNSLIGTDPRAVPQ